MKVFPGLAVRPTTDRVREAVFNILAPQVLGSRFLDLYAGTGAVGLEALSRGATLAVFVEKNRRVAAVLLDNLMSSGVSDQALVRIGEAGPEVVSLGREGSKFDLVFMDPPYAGGLVEETLREISQADLVDHTGRIIVESSYRNPPAVEVAGFGVWRRERYGEALVSFYRQEDNP